MNSTGRRDDHPERAAGAFYGRRKGKALRPAQQALMAELLPRLRIDVSAPTPADLALLYEPKVEAVRLEIGSGGGEHVVGEAAASPQIGHIAAEPFINGVAKTLAAIDEHGLSNLLLFDDDATRLLDWLPVASLARIDLLYPDPWPKRRHWKRRFVNRDNLDRFARVLEPGGVFRFASDIDTYVNWTLAHVLAHPDFEWTARRAADWNEPWPGWTRTRYEAKAIREGRHPAFLVFRRVAP